MNQSNLFDCIVIGGGVTGTGTARDLAMRGLNVLLVEKRDFAGGTTGTASGMIHGGVRYLMYDIPTTKLSCLDSGYIQKIAPQLIFRIPFLYPVPAEGLYSKVYIELVESFFTAYDKYQPLKGGKDHIRLNREQVLAIEPGLTPDIIGAVSIDEWGIDTFRLSILNARAAQQHGAMVLNHTEVISILRDGPTITGIRVRDTLNGSIQEFKSRMVVNAAGPWVPKIAALAGVEVKLRPAKGIHLIFDRRIVNNAIIVTTIDGRSIFLQPHENTSLLGTTDDDYYGDPDYITATQDEVEYLVQAAEPLFPAIREARIIRVMAGIRPTLFKWGPIEDRLSREHEIYDHRTRDGVSGFVTIAGGKLASYRVMAEEMADMVANALGNREKSRTHSVPLPGGDRQPNVHELAKRFGVPAFIVQRIAFRHGSEAESILQLTVDHPEWKTIICSCESVIEAEIRYVIRNEFVRILDDLRRRTRFGMGICQGCNCSFKGALILADELNYTASQTQQFVRDFLQARWKGKSPILMRGQLAQESISRGIYFCSGSMKEGESCICQK